MTTVARVARGHQRLGVLAWMLWALVMLGMLVTVWLDQLLRRAGRGDLSSLNDAGVSLLAMVSAATVGALLGSRRPRHPVGWLLLSLALSLAAALVSWSYAIYGLLARPGALPAAAYAGVVNTMSVFPTLASLGFILLLTPTGSLPSARWRGWARITAVAATVGPVATALVPFEAVPYQATPNPLAVSGVLGSALQAVGFVAFVVTGLAVPVGGWSLLVRFRQARGVERQQLRWLAVAATLVAMVALAMALLLVMGARTSMLLGWLTRVGVVLLPLATGAAILRYRLYDLDRILSRTLTYGLLTVLLGGGYAGVVLVLGQLLGQDSSLVVAVATLAVAAVFQPARRRIQQAVDRRFNRRRYDAARTIEAFSARLRQQLDLDTLTVELLAVVEETMQPTWASLWLRPSPDASSPAVAWQQRHELDAGVG